jgi:hypothetical protein
MHEAATSSASTTPANDKPTNSTTMAVLTTVEPMTKSTAELTEQAVLKISTHDEESLKYITTFLTEDEDSKSKQRLAVLNWLKSGYDVKTNCILPSQLTFPSEIDPDSLISGMNFLLINNNWHIWNRALTIYYDKHNEGTKKDKALIGIIAEDIIRKIMLSKDQFVIFNLKYFNDKYEQTEANQLKLLEYHKLYLAYINQQLNAKTYAISSNGTLDKILKMDEPFALQYLKKHPTYFRHFPKLLEKREVMLTILKARSSQKIFELGYFENKWHTIKKELAVDMTKANAWAYLYLPEIFQLDITIIEAAIRRNYNLIPHINKKFIKGYEYYKHVKDIIDEHPLTLELEKGYFGNAKPVVLEAVKKNGLALQFASEELRKCFDVIKAAIINNSDAIPYISKDYKKDKPYFELIRSLILGKSQSHILKYHDEKEFFKSDVYVLEKAITGGYTKAMQLLSSSALFLKRTPEQKMEKLIFLSRFNYRVIQYTPASDQSLPFIKIIFYEILSLAQYSTNKNAAYDQHLAHLKYFKVDKHNEVKRLIIPLICSCTFLLQCFSSELRQNVDFMIELLENYAKFDFEKFKRTPWQFINRFTNQEDASDIKYLKRYCWISKHDPGYKLFIKGYRKAKKDLANKKEVTVKQLPTGGKRKQTDKDKTAQLEKRQKTAQNQGVTPSV